MTEEGEISDSLTLAGDELVETASWKRLEPILVEPILGQTMPDDSTLLDTHRLVHSIPAWFGSSRTLLLSPPRPSVA